MGETKGNLIIIGGAEDKKGEKKILEEIVTIAGDHDAHLIVFTTATQEPGAIGDEYKKVFSRLGVKQIDIMDINTRDEANMEEHAEQISQASGIFFTGGDQLRITSILAGTRTYEALHDAFQGGAVIAGTSAGASVMSNTMIVEGNNNDPARKCTLKMAPGFNFLDGVIIDQHFDQRGRFGRLLCGVAENPGILGIGIDEDTAIRVYADDHFKVIGNNAVTVIDGKSIKSSNVSESKPDEILTITNVTVHVLSQGYGFDLKKREVMRLH
ncbi:cyanophycinase [Dehalobacterium formicoaceticum]|uniref:Cyanophycinase n=1 Tax=Dehalobacterium formicoaceticum TaxID=51515 RepID=A0ABT1Y750_9FIRM|nr:cyanophycinase [Dehalobacterium formicoaceticum]MCR6546301.1 cyanophycinase [Dehalobacterium formicoaceticum]